MVTQDATFKVNYMLKLTNAIMPILKASFTIWFCFLSANVYSVTISAFNRSPIQELSFLSYAANNGYNVDVFEFMVYPRDRDTDFSSLPVGSAPNCDSRLYVSHFNVAIYDGLYNGIQMNKYDCMVRYNSILQAKGNWRVYVQNNTTSPLDVTAYLRVTHEGSVFVQKYIYTSLPAGTSCSATIDNITIGNLLSGGPPIIKNFPFSISSAGTETKKTLVISGVDIQSNGKLNLGGSSSGVKVYPPESYILGSTWNLGSSSGNLPLNVEYSTASPGVWTSSLLATLNCP